MKYWKQEQCKILRSRQYCGDILLSKLKLDKDMALLLRTLLLSGVLITASVFIPVAEGESLPGRQLSLNTSNLAYLSLLVLTPVFSLVMVWLLLIIKKQKKHLTQAGTKIRQLKRTLNTQNVERENEAIVRKQKESYMNTILDSILVECWAMDTNSYYTLQNAASRKIVGNVIGRHISEVGVPKHLLDYWNENNKKVLSGKIIRSEYDLDVRGKKRHYENMVVPVIIDGKIIGTVGNAIDITVRKRAVEDLKQRELLLSALYCISNATHTTNNLEQLYDSIKSSIVKLFGSSNVSLALYDKETDVLEFKFTNDAVVKNLSLIKNASQSASILFEVIKKGDIVLLDENQQREILNKRGYTVALEAWSQSLLGVPLKSRDDILGALVVHNYESKNKYNQTHTEMLVSIADQITLAIQRKRAEKELQKAQKQLVQKAHKSGMADIANYAMHVIGNILNSLKTTVDLLTELNNNSAIDSLIDANSVLKDNVDSIETFIIDDPRSKKLLEYYLILGDSFKSEHELTQKHLIQLREKADSITKVVKTLQQSFSGASDISTEQDPRSLLDEATTLRREDLEARKIKVLKQYSKVPKVWAQRTKLLHVIDLITENAIESLANTDETKRRISFSLETKANSVQIAITDTGEGIDGKNLIRIFAHGFSSRRNKNGFGLHTCANFIAEMKGKIWAESEGRNRGTSVVINLPCVKQKDDGRSLREEGG